VRRRAALGAVFAAVLAVIFAVLAAPRGDTPSITTRAAADAHSQGPVLVVRQRLVGPKSDGYPIEGSVSFVRLRGPGVVRYAANFSHQDFTIRYPAQLTGTFRLTSFQRVCGGACTRLQLERPSERCARRFHVAKGVTTASIRLRFGHGCKIAVHAAGS
jgi:hypothetical protein